MSTSSDATPAFSPTPERVAEARSQGISECELSPIEFGQSRRLRQLELAIYLAMFISASLALLPFLFTTWYWPMAWLAFSVLLGKCSWACWRWDFPSRVLYCSNSRWFVRDIGGERELMLRDEILLWPHIIILPLRDSQGRNIHLLLTPDAMTADDWRRLRVWLRFFSDSRS